ncbi:uncharacterized protein [Montipora capricornis]|uniref:uncharacterized protein n=1 Tax=Montipora capricornis TaxID=246305 RepID=UPI0035F154D6
MEGRIHLPSGIAVNSLTEEERKKPSTDAPFQQKQTNMEFKGFLLCFAFFVVTASGATVCKCVEEQKKEPAVEKYTLKVDDGKKQIEETIEVDTEKETETFDIPSDGDTDPNAPGDVKSIYDFKRNLAMYRLSNQKVCFLRNSTSEMPNPQNLMELLDNFSLQKKTMEPTQKTFQYTIDGILNDRSILSDEMATMCAKNPIYLVKERSSLSAELEKKEVLKRKLNRIQMRICVIYGNPWQRMRDTRAQYVATLTKITLKGPQMDFSRVAREVKCYFR